MTLISKVLTHAISNLSRKNTGHDQEATQMIKTKSQKRKKGWKGRCREGESALLSNFHANEGNACACMHVCSAVVLDGSHVNAN